MMIYNTNTQGLTGFGSANSASAWSYINKQTKQQIIFSHSSLSTKCSNILLQTRYSTAFTNPQWSSTPVHKATYWTYDRYCDMSHVVNLTYI